MPSQNYLRLNDLSRINKARPEPGHPYEQRAIAAAQPKTRRRPLQSDGKLMAEKQILCEPGRDRIFGRDRLYYGISQTQ
jgi:hypothetical protein